MKMDFQSLGKRVRTHRAACDLNQTQLGALLGAHQQDISLVENGKRKPKAPMMVRLHAWLKTAPDVVRLQKNMEATRKG